MADTHCGRKDAFYIAHQKNLNEDKPVLSAAKMLVVDSSF